MRPVQNLWFLLLVVVSMSGYGQDEFTLASEGLSPRFTTLTTDTSPPNSLYEKVLDWVEANKELLRLTIEDQTKPEAIQLTSFKSNAVRLDKQYFNAKYTIKLSFLENKLHFEPLRIHLKQNSKYDMGWKSFDLRDGSKYYKKGKVTRKYKAYLKDLTSGLNELNKELKQWLISN